MTVPPTPADDQTGDDPKPAAPAVDRELLDRIFGTVLPETTSDERDHGAATRSDEDWYRQNRPPHHG